MKLNKLIWVSISAVALNMAFMANAYAVAVDVKCNATDVRSKVSVDGSGLRAGSYVAKVTSGGVTIKSKAQNADPITREVEFDFDSKRADIAAGATAIAAGFIKNGSVVGSIFAAGGTSPIASASAVCKTK